MTPAPLQAAWGLAVGGLNLQPQYHYTWLRGCIQPLHPDPFATYSAHGKKGSVPKDSCVEHPRDYYLELRRDYMRLFDGDQYAAILLAFFEFSTNGELARQRIAGESKDPWVKASTPAIHQETLELCSIRTIQDRIDLLLRHEVLLCQERPGITKSYLLDFKKINSLLVSGAVLTPPDGDPGKFAGVAKTTPLLPGSGGVLNLKEEELITEEYKPSIGSQVESMENSERGGITNKILKGRLLSTKGAKRPDAKEMAATGEWLTGRSETDDEILGAHQEWLSDEYWRELKFPWWAFRKHFEKYLERYRKARLNALDPTGGHAPGEPAQVSWVRDGKIEAPQPAQSLPSAARGSRNWVAEWNMAVPELHTDFNPGKNSTALIATSDQQFVDHFENICEAGRQLFQKKGAAASWANFYWMIATKPGHVTTNWKRLLWGDLRHMAAPESRSGPPVKEGPVTKVLREMEEERVRKEKENGTT